MKGNSRTSELDEVPVIGPGTRLYGLHDTGTGLQDVRWQTSTLLDLLGRERLARYQHMGDVAHLEIELPGGYRGFELVGWLMFGEGANLRYPTLILSPDGGATWRNGTGDYEWAARYSWPAGTASAGTHTNDHSPGKFAGSPGTEAIALGVNLMPGRRSSLFLTILAAAEAGVRTAVFWRSAMHHNTDALRTNDGTGFCTAYEAHNRLRLYDSDGGADLTAFDLTLYGLR
jgi:hypothetical protein